MDRHRTSNILHQTTFSKAEKFWYGWLKVAATLVTIFGILLVFFNHTRGFEFLNQKIAEVFFLSPEMVMDMASLQSWMIGVIGATTAGWGLTLMYLIFVPLKRKEKWAWNAITISLALWFVLDTWISTHYGAKFNVILNIAFAMQFFAPLLFIRSTMKKAQ